MKIYSIVVTFLFIAALGYIALIEYVEIRDKKFEVARFDDFDGNKELFKLAYSNNGDLTFSPIMPNRNMPAITYWDYYGSTEVIGYNWIDEKTIVIEMRDSLIQISLANFKVETKK